MSRLTFPLAGPSNERGSVLDNSRRVNLAPVLTENAQGRAQAGLVTSPGLTSFTELPGALQAQIEVGEKLYVVAGGKLCSVSSAGVVTTLASVAAADAVVGLSSDGNEIVIGNGGPFLVWNIATASIATLSVVGTWSACLDGFTLLASTEGDLWYSEPGEATNVGGTNFVNAEYSEDELVGVIADGGLAYLFGSKSLEVWDVTGGADDALARVSGGTIDMGCNNARSIVKGFDNSFVWEGRNEKGGGQIWRYDGAPRRISTHAVETAIRRAGGLVDAFAFQLDGHTVYQFNTASSSWRYDPETQLWHEVADLVDGVLTRHRATQHAYSYGRHLVGDCNGSTLWELDPDAYANGSDPLVRLLRFHAADPEDRLVTFDRLHLHIETGVGLDGSGQGADPKVMLRYSDDGGRSWSDQIDGSLGRIGETNAVLEWWRLGSSRDRLFEVSISDPVSVTISAAHADVRVGRA